MQIEEIAAEAFDDADRSGPAGAVRVVAEACDAYDGVNTLNERACLELKYRGLSAARLWVARSEEGDGGIDGIDGIDGFALVHGSDLDLAVHPERRHRGVGTALTAAALADLDVVEAWSHADDHAAAHLGARFGIPRSRELLVMSRRTAMPLTPTDAPAGITVRTYTDGDETELLRINAEAFAHHPEQGHMTVQDFRDRVAEPWFDPEGLFLAVDADDNVLGFHWTKVHRDENPPYGEVYVVAVDPRAAGRGIGKLLTSVGIDHLSRAGVDEVILYVEGDNEPAIAVYHGQGFARSRTEAQYAGKVGKVGSASSAG